MQKQKPFFRSGFTIIELVLVLAVAGLVFLMVFVALPNLQRSQRDTQRRQDYANLLANVTQYMVNNNGKLPNAPSSGANWSYATDSKNLINSTGKAPDGDDYVLVIISQNSYNSYLHSGTPTISSLGITAYLNPLKPPTVFVVTKAQCGNLTVEAAGSKSFAIVGGLEAGDFYCIDNGD